MAAVDHLIDWAVDADAVPADRRPVLEGYAERLASGEDWRGFVDGFASVPEERWFFEHAAPEAVWGEWYREREWDRFQHTGTTTDAVVVTYDGRRDGDCSYVTPARDSLKTLLIRRFTNPYRGEWALPGTFLTPDDANADAALARMLTKRIGMDTTHAVAQQFYTFTGRDRDPRGQISSIAHLVYVRDGLDSIAEEPGMRWVPFRYALGARLAFDHEDILRMAEARMRDQFGWTPNIFEALPREFTVTDAIRIRCALFDEEQDSVRRRNFLKKYERFWHKLGHVDPDDESSPNLYEYDRRSR